MTGGVSGEKLNPLIGGTLKAELLHSVDLWVEERTAHPVQLRVNEPEGNAWLIEWQRPVVVEVVPSANPTASIDAQFSGLRVTIRLQGKSFTWERVALNGRVLAVEEITL